MKRAWWLAISLAWSSAAHAKGYDSIGEKIDLLRAALSTGLLTGMYAKEHCSCLFVLRRDGEFCRHFAREKLAPGVFTDLFLGTDVDAEAKTVTARPAAWVSLVFDAKARTAAWKDERLGCSLKD